MRCLIEDADRIESHVTRLVTPFLVTSNDFRTRWHASTVSCRYSHGLEQLKRNLADAKPRVFVMCTPLTKQAGEWVFERNNGTTITFREFIQAVTEHQKITDAPIRYIVLPRCDDGVALINDFKEDGTIDIIVSKHSLPDNEVDTFCASMIFNEIQCPDDSIADTIEFATLQVEASTGTDLTGKFIVK